MSLKRKYLDLVAATDESLKEHDDKHHDGHYEEGQQCIKRERQGEGDKADAIASANPNARTNRLAPNGKRSNLTEKQWHQVRSKEFKAWFGDWENDPENASKVVDENGEPMVVYHGTKPTARFRVFIPSMPGRNGKYYGTGSYFTESYGEAKNYGKGRVYECFLNIKKPSEGWNGKEPNSEEFGCDGAHIRLQGFWVATRPNQIKSAVNNSGRFSFDTDDIYDTIGKDGNPVIVKLKDIERKAKIRFQEPKPIYIKDLLLQKDEDFEYLD